jgi:hypothetical protein
MRTMDIPPFENRVEIADIPAFTNARLAEEFKLSQQGSAVAGYMLYPAGKEARASFGAALRSVPDPLRLNLMGMSRIQYRWLRVADVLHLHYDMAIGGHQSRRGGATISKAAHLAAKNTKSVGTSEATFWSAWKAFKDVAPLVTATVLIWDNARRVFRNEYLGAFRTRDDAEPITLDQLSPFHITLLMPDFVLAVARSFEDFALTKVTGRVDAVLDPKTLWRIPEEMNRPIRLLRICVSPFRYLSTSLRRPFGNSSHFTSTADLTGGSTSRRFGQPGTFWTFALPQ